MTEQTGLTLQAVVTHGEEQVFTIVDGEAVLMSVENGKYYKLDDIGTHIWTSIQNPISVGVLCDQLVAEFKVERALCQEDVMELLDKLLQQNLIRVTSDVG